ncbi:hypothetical protein AGMMS50256_33060 [Betaproteobacteria bacterium]|nr:hypothetical protein AGMMS50256_33060 [Betaproteobacteria bacterium]
MEISPCFIFRFRWVASISSNVNWYQTLSGNISGNGSLTKSGDGTLTLSGINNSDGDTTVSGGTLSIGSDGNIGNGERKLVGGTLQLTQSTTYSKGYPKNACSFHESGYNAPSFEPGGFR